MRVLSGGLRRVLLLFMLRSWVGDLFCGFVCGLSFDGVDGFYAYKGCNYPHGGLNAEDGDSQCVDLHIRVGVGRDETE